MKVKALITAAGLGKRFGALTRRTNKALLRVKGKPLIHHIVSRLRGEGIRDVVVVVGYQGAALRHSLGNGVRTVLNPFYRVSGILGSFWAARDELDGRAFVFTTSDHFFRRGVLRGILRAEGDVRIVVQKKPRYTKEDAKVIISGSRIVRIGKDIPLEEADGEFGGMTYFSPKASRLFFEETERMFEDGGLHGYMMEVLAALAARHGLPIRYSLCGEDSRIEVDSVHDLIAARRMAKK